MRDDSETSAKKKIYWILLYTGFPVFIAQCINVETADLTKFKGTPLKLLNLACLFQIKMFILRVIIL